MGKMEELDTLMEREDHEIHKGRQKRERQTRKVVGYLEGVAFDLAGERQRHPRFSPADSER